MKVPVKREIDTSSSQTGEQLVGLVARSKRPVSDTDGIDGRHVHGDRVKCLSSLLQPLVEPLVHRRIDRGAGTVQHREASPAIREAEGAPPEGVVVRRGIFAELVIAQGGVVGHVQGL